MIHSRCEGLLSTLPSNVFPAAPSWPSRHWFPAVEESLERFQGFMLLLTSSWAILAGEFSSFSSCRLPPLPLARCTPAKDRHTFVHLPETDTQWCTCQNHTHSCTPVQKNTQLIVHLPKTDTQRCTDTDTQLYPCQKQTCSGTPATHTHTLIHMPQPDTQLYTCIKRLKVSCTPAKNRHTAVHLQKKKKTTYTQLSADEHTLSTNTFCFALSLCSLLVAPLHWPRGQVSASRAADLGSIPALPVDLFPSLVIPVT